MIPNRPEWQRLLGLFHAGLAFVEYAGLLVIGFATTFAMGEEIVGMIEAARVTLADLLLMFLYLEVLAMIGQYFKTGQMPVRFPLYIAMVAMARYIILEVKDLTELRMLANAQAGYVSGETLRNYEDSEEVLVISTWQTPEAWTKWFTDRRRQEVQARVDELLGSRTTYTVYHH